MRTQEEFNLAVFMHGKYEEIAAKNGWKTQDKTRVAFGKLPKENRDTMLDLAKEVMLFFNKDIVPAKVSERQVELLIKYAKFGMVETNQPRKDMVDIESIGNNLKALVKRQK